MHLCAEGQQAGLGGGHDERQARVALVPNASAFPISVMALPAMLTW